MAVLQNVLNRFGFPVVATLCDGGFQVDEPQVRGELVQAFQCVTPNLGEIHGPWNTTIPLFGKFHVLTSIPDIGLIENGIAWMG